MFNQKKEYPDTEEKESLPKLLFSMVIIFAIVMFFTHNIARLALTVGNSMNDALENGQLLLVDEVTRPDDYERYDIVVVKTPKASVSHVIKRVIGLPGETVQIINGTVYINGTALEDDPGNEKIKDAGLAANPVTLGEGEFFVMGDNRNNSVDSRSTVVGNVKENYIIGKVWIRIIPFRLF